MGGRHRHGAALPLAGLSRARIAAVTRAANAARDRRSPAVARQLGFAADPTMLQTVQVSIDALVSAEVMPFRRAVLGYEHRADSPEEDWQAAARAYDDLQRISGATLGD